MRRTALAAAAAALAACMPPDWGANALLHPQRRELPGPPGLPHRDVTLGGDEVTLRGWLFAARPPARGITVVYLHGSGDNRASGSWIAERLVAAGYDVLAYDSRAHGESGGDACTYGFREKRDLALALDQLGVTRAIAIGVSLGGAVALQAAAEDRRIEAVVAVAPFSDLETVARERAPWFASERQVREALAIAQRDGAFEVAAVSPAASARRVLVPVLLVHGAEDAETSPDHSRRIFAALAGSRRLRIVEGAGHADALGRTWAEVESWIAEAAESGDRTRPLTPSRPP